MNLIVRSLLPLVGIFVSYYFATNNPREIAKLLHEMRIVAMHEISRPWGCPSAFNKDACDVYDPNRY